MRWPGERHQQTGGHGALDAEDASLGRHLILECREKTLADLREANLLGESK